MFFDSWDNHGIINHEVPPSLQGICQKCGCAQCAWDDVVRMSDDPMSVVWVIGIIGLGFSFVCLTHLAIGWGTYGGFHEWGYPQMAGLNMFKTDSAIKMDDSWVPLFQDTST